MQNLSTIPGKRIFGHWPSKQKQKPKETFSYFCREKIDELERRGFEVSVLHHNYARSHGRYYCRIRNQKADLTFFGDTKEMALIKAIEFLPPE
jgi:hypothetical protein